MERSQSCRYTKSVVSSLIELYKIQNVALIMLYTAVHKHIRLNPSTHIVYKNSLKNVLSRLATVLVWGSAQSVT